MAAYTYGGSPTKRPTDVPPGYTGHVPHMIDTTGESFGRTVRRGNDPNATASVSATKAERFGQSCYRADFDSTAKAAASPTRTNGGGSPTKSPAKLSEVNILIAMLRERLRERGTEGIRSLGVAFRVMDDDGNRKLNTYEFRKALSQLGLSVSAEERDMLISYFDHDGDGNISFDELLVALRGRLNNKRRALVEKAFNKLDVDGSGVVTVDDISQVYDVSQHPKVINGDMTPEEAYRDFLFGFEGSCGNRDGQVTRDEFINYFGNVSASIDRDDYFAFMMSQAWGVEADE